MIGYVPQSIYLLEGTIRENVAFGEPESDIDDSRVDKALKMAQLETYIQSLERGKESIVGERGVRISGGQQQRIAIARALYRNPQVLILDEATSALDHETERQFMDTIESLIGQITLIIIAHRLSTVMGCDRIFEVKDGQLVERRKKDLQAIEV